MAAPVRILVCSDIHYASELEKLRGNYEVRSITNPVQRMLVSLYRRHFWLRDPFAHNELLEKVLNPPAEPDHVVANGDYSCDSAFIGVSDPAALQSARECLSRLRERFPGKVLATFGDHELGKMSLCGGHGGLRLQSFEVAQRELELEPVWTHRVERYVLVGVTSSLLAMAVYERETLDHERPDWRELSRQHFAAIEAVFNALRPNDRVLLFCHDPTALPYLWRSAVIQSKVSQIERTVIGHLHSPLMYRQSLLLSGMPTITFFGQAIRRMSSALALGKDWRHFNVLLCPSLAGLELTKSGGFYEVHLDPSGQSPAQFHLHRTHW